MALRAPITVYAPREPKERKEEVRSFDFDALRISVASPEQMLSWSYGEVTKPETINYRTQKPERDGLFDERIFGPTKDWQCYCGKYKKVRYKGIICDKCGVEVTRSAVRRERMGHIDLAVPVAHIWYVRGVPSIIGTLLDISVVDLERVIYFAGFIIMGVNDDVKLRALEQLESEYREALAKETDVLRKDELTINYKSAKYEINDLKRGQVISEGKYHDISLRFGNIIKVGIGAEAVLELLKTIDLAKVVKELEEEIGNTQGAQKRRMMRRLRIMQDMHRAGLKADWLVLIRVPVLPPDLRPMVQLDGGRFAASDLNDLYRRVINRNNRLKKLLSQGAPEVILRNEKRMLQEAVDALIDNSARRGRAQVTATQRKLRSLSDMLRGKQGRFRQNLLGKRVDYSGRSVIVTGPTLQLNQCGLPKVMALELFKPFVISRLIREGYVHNVKNASRLIERGTPEVWDILEEITRNYYVLLNRAPTLHRLGIQSFQPVLIEGKSIQLHPLTNHAYNADFDGDQMAVHVPLSEMARKEAEELMRSNVNLLKPASGEPIVTPRLDMILGLYVMTSILPGAKGEGKVFGSPKEAVSAYHAGLVHLRANIHVRLDVGDPSTHSADTQSRSEQGRRATGSGSARTVSRTERVETSVGRLLFNEVVPPGIGFVNEVMTTGAIKSLTSRVYRELGIEATSAFVDKLKDLGFETATLSGVTFSMQDIMIPQEKRSIVAEAEKQLAEIDKQYHRGLITDTERRTQAISLWSKVKEQIEANMIKAYGPENPIYVTVKSGARGSFAQITQLGGMIGLVVNPTGEIIELPVLSNYKEGLDVIEYFNSTHGARKGKSDTSLRTSDAGYLTRRLVDVAQDIVIADEDCGSDIGLPITRSESAAMGMKFADRIVGRYLLDDVKDKGKTIAKKGDEVTRDLAAAIDAAGVEQITVRSPLFCKAEWGVCQKCYGWDLSKNLPINIGEVVGIMAAQAIGEPGTQLTMKTFHMGGVHGADITSGLPRVEELFEARSPRTPALLAEIEGVVNVREEKEATVITVTADTIEEREYKLQDGYRAAVKDKDVVRPRQAIAVAAEKKAIRTEIGGRVKVKDGAIVVSALEKETRRYEVPSAVAVKVKDGDKVTLGTELTEGHLDLELSLRWKGKLSTMKYIIASVQEIYQSQGQAINDKHIEIIVSRMFSKVRIDDAGDSNYLPGGIEDRRNIERLNEKLKKVGKKPIVFEDTILGITRVALKTDSFLSAASFQETTGVLIDAAVRGATDYLKGLKENVIIGKLIPAGTAFRKPQAT